jgi:hypothetical protein
MEVTFLIHLNIHIYQLLDNFTTKKESFQERMHHLVELDENRRKSFDCLKENQGKVNKLFDRKAKKREFQSGYLVFMWDRNRENPGKNGKFDSLWRGPFNVESAT